MNQTSMIFKRKVFPGYVGFSWLCRFFLAMSVFPVYIGYVHNWAFAQSFVSRLNHFALVQFKIFFSNNRHCFKLQYLKLYFVLFTMQYACRNFSKQFSIISVRQCGPQVGLNHDIKKENIIWNPVEMVVSQIVLKWEALRTS